MKRSRFSEAQFAFVLRQGGGGQSSCCCLEVLPPTVIRLLGWRV